MHIVYIIFHVLLGGTDYTQLSEVAVFNEENDELMTCFTIQIIKDGALEQVEAFMVIANTTDIGVIIVNSSVTIIIQDSDGRLYYLEIKDSLN